MKISISTGCFYFLPLERVLNIFQKSGFEHVEIVGYWKDREWEVGQNIKGLSRQKIVAEIKKAGLSISAFHDPSGAVYTKNDSISLPQTKKIVKNKDIPYIIMHLPHSLKTNIGWWQEYQSELAEQYRALNIYQKICIENMAPIDGYDLSITDIEELYKFCDLLGCFVNLDMVHLIESKQNLKKSIMLLNDKIKNVHISGYKEGKRVHFQDSEIDVLGYIKYLDFKNVEMITIETCFDPAINNDKIYIKQCKILRKQLQNAINQIKLTKLPFSKPTLIGNELLYVQKTMSDGHISGNGTYTKKCQNWFVKNYSSKHTILTTSCTHALELAANICGIGKDDEVIMPSYTFTATANAFVNVGANLRFVDIKPEDMNINEHLIEEAITSKTKAIVIVHYAGIACNMEKIKQIAKKYNLYVIEDAAQAILCEYENHKLGTIGDVGCFSFHATKNITMGEGGALLVNNENLIEKAICMSDNGIDRRAFLAGKIDHYQWMDKGASYMASDLNAAFLFAQLEKANHIIGKRIQDWKTYQSLLIPLENKQLIELPKFSEKCKHNGHIFFIKCKEPQITKQLQKFLKIHNIEATSHYVPLHITEPGKKYGKMVGEDRYTTIESLKLLRLPLFYSIKSTDIYRVVQDIYDFFEVQFHVR